MSITLDAANPEEATATIIVKPFKDEGRTKTFQFLGSIDELESALATDLGEAVAKIHSHQGVMEDLDAQIAADKAKVNEANKAKGKANLADVKAKAKAKPVTKAAAKAAVKKESVAKLAAELKPAAAVVTPLDLEDFDLSDLT